MENDARARGSIFPREGALPSFDQNALNIYDIEKYSATEPIQYTCGPR